MKKGFIFPRGVFIERERQWRSKSGTYWTM
jgi:hypothetical protein